MKHIVQTIILACILGTCFSCHSKDIEILELAERCMETDADSAMEMLGKIDTSTVSTDFQKAKYAFLWTQASHKCKKHLENDSLIDLAVTYFTKNNEKHYAAKALLYKGLLHKEQKEPEKAAEAFALSEHWFEGIEDNQYKALLHSHYGMLMHGQKNYEEALIHLKKSLKHKLKGDSIHYIFSGYASIANTFELLGEIDSAKTYFEKGLQYKDKVSQGQYYRYMKDYANFLGKIQEYDRAEDILLECKKQIKNDQIYSVYSCLSTLYRNMGRYQEALSYAEKMLETKDSIMLQGCNLLLYHIHMLMGNENTANNFHLQYRMIENELNKKLKSKKVAIIPHEVEKQILKEEKQESIRIQWHLIMWLVLMSAIIIAIYQITKKMHTHLQNKLKDEVGAHQKDIHKYTHKLIEKDLEIKKQTNFKNWEIGSIKGGLKQMENSEKNMKEKFTKKEEEMKEKEKDIKMLKSEKKLMEKENKQLKKELEEKENKQKKLQKIIDTINHKDLIDKQIETYRIKGNHQKAVNLLIQLKYGKSWIYPSIENKDFLYLLGALLTTEVKQSIEQQTKNTTKQAICYLIALGFDDEDMMFRATEAQLETIRKYRKECLSIVENTNSINNY